MDSRTVKQFTKQIIQKGDVTTMAGMRTVTTVEHDVVQMSLGNSTKPSYPKTGVDAVDGVMPVAKGGTGLNQVTGGYVMASALGGAELEETAIPTNVFDGLRGNIQNQFDDTYSENDKYVGNIDKLCGPKTSGVYWVDPLNEETLGRMPFAEKFLLSVISSGNVTVHTAYAETLDFVKTRLSKPVTEGGEPTWTQWIDFGISPNVKLRSYAVNVTPDNWTEISSGGWYKDIAIDGILESDNPTINIVPRGNNTEEVTAEREAYCCIGRVDTFNGLIRVYCFEQVMTTTVCIGILCDGT